MIGLANGPCQGFGKSRAVGEVAAKAPFTNDGAHIIAMVLTRDDPDEEVDGSDRRRQRQRQQRGRADQKNGGTV
jgi:hypothetical protein